MYRFRRMILFLAVFVAFALLGSAAAGAEGETELNGWVSEDGNMYYYIDGWPVSGCIWQIDGEWYCFRGDGSLLEEDETCALSDSEGNIFWVRAGWDNILLWNEWYTVPDTEPKERYYYGDAFAALCGPNMVDGVFYLFDDETGRLLCNTGVQIDGAWWESNQQGILIWLEPAGDGNAQDPLPSPDPVQNPGQDPDQIPSSNSENDDPPEQNSGSPDISDTPDNSPEPQEADTVPENGWLMIDGEKYYYRDGKPISAGMHVIEWTEYFFDETGILLHDCIVNDYLLNSDGTAVREGIAELSGQKYYVNPETHKIVRDEEISVENKVYIVDADGRMREKVVITADTVRTPGGISTDTGDPDIGYIPVNEEENSGRTIETEPRTGTGMIRYSDSYVPGSGEMETLPSEAADSEPGTVDNPGSGLLYYRNGAWTEVHGSSEKPIEICLSVNGATMMKDGVALRDVIICCEDGVFGYDQFGNELPPGLVTRYGRTFYLTGRQPASDLQLLLLMS